MPKGSLYLVPSLLGGDNYDYCLPAIYKEILPKIRYYITEDIRTTRRFLKPGGFAANFDDAVFFVLNKHTRYEDLLSFLEPVEKGCDMALMSEAGCPCIADPGNIIVEMAHQKGIRVIPLVGPSSIMLALMASGFNGQHFTFRGYLPIKQTERIKKIKEIEADLYKNSCTQIFIETPYRNQVLFDDILKSAMPHTKLCVALNISLPDENIITKTITDWKKQDPDMNKKQAVFLMYK